MCDSPLWRTRQLLATCLPLPYLPFPFPRVYIPSPKLHHPRLPPFSIALRFCQHLTTSPASGGSWAFPRHFRRKPYLACLAMDPRAIAAIVSPFGGQPTSKPAPEVPPPRPHCSSAVLPSKTMSLNSEASPAEALEHASLNTFTTLRLCRAALRRRGHGNEADPSVPCPSLISLFPDPWLQLQP